MRSVKCLLILLLALIYFPKGIFAQQTQSSKNIGKDAQINAQTNSKNGNQNTNSKDKSGNSKTSVKSTSKPSAKTPSKTNTAKAQTAFDALKAAGDTTERIEKINKFIADFPDSELKLKAAEMLIVSEIEAGETDFRNGERATGATHFRQAARAFDQTDSDQIFKDLIIKLPFNLFYRSEPIAALEVAKEIESKVNDNPARLLALVNFYLATENADEAKRLAAHAAEIAPASVDAQMALGMAQRIAFHLEASAQAYARALELDPASAAAKRNLADAWRGLGQTEDALKLYRELLAADAADEAAHNGLVLALFATGDKDEAEKELTAALAQNPKNLILQTTAAYWYATNGDGARAVALAVQAVATEPRYVWGQIALARGLILEKRPLEAERALIIARQYGKFPTLDYEIANAHFAAGLYDEAADDLRRSFTLENGKLQTKLAGREEATAENFNDLLARERRASIFEPISASGENEDHRLKELLTFANNLPENSDQSVLLEATQDFLRDPDQMQAHRELYVADKLLNRKIALDQVLTITQNATGSLEQSLDAPAATAAVLAQELYEPRRIAAASGNIVDIPVVPRETLRQIMRGRVEEISGWALYQENKPEEAVVRLRRAVGVLPENSAWWRSSYWRLGSALEASGKPAEALDAYIKSYQSDVPNETRLVVIQSLYQRINGSLDGLEKRLSQREVINPAVGQKLTTARAETPVPTPAPSFKNPLPNVIAKINSPKPSGTPQSAEAKSVAAPDEAASPRDAKSEATPETKIAETPEIKPEIVAVATETSTPKIKNQAASVANSSSAPTEKEVEPEPKPDASTLNAKLETVAPPSVEIKPSEKAVLEIKNEAETKNEAKTEEKAATKPELASEVTAQAIDKSAPLAEIKETKTGEVLTEPVLTTVATNPAIVANENTSLEKRASEPKQSESNDSNSSSQATDDSLSRPRVVIVPLNNLSAPNVQTENGAKSPGACLMQVNQSELSILRNGGTVALIITFANGADAAKLNVVVNSPSDISVTLLPNDDANGDHRLIQISSISEITKTYTITLESPCGQQEVKVKVR